MSNKITRERRPGSICRSMILLATSVPFVASASQAQSAPTTISAPTAPLPSYARAADLVTETAAIAVVQATDTLLIPPARAPGLQPGKVRILVQAQTLRLIRGNDVMNRDISFLIDLADDGSGKAPKWKGRTFIIFGRVPNQVNFFQLQSSESILNWSPEAEAMIRRVVAGLDAPNAPPVVKGVSSAFHVSSAVEGEGETQIFLDTAKGHPISLSIVRRKDEQPLFGAALGEIVDDTAALPKPDTPLWYRLACFLPQTLPAKATKGLARADATAAARDYAAFIKAMAPCDRTSRPIH